MCYEHTFLRAIHRKPEDVVVHKPELEARVAQKRFQVGHGPAAPLVQHHLQALLVVDVGAVVGEHAPVVVEGAQHDVGARHVGPVQ